MKYFYDTEFIEDGKTIDLVSIGIVAEDGREYYAQSVEFDESKANPWVKDNVIPLLQPCICGTHSRKTQNPRSKYILDCPWRTRLHIKRDILAFMDVDVEKYGTPELWGYYSAYDHVAFCQLFGTMMDLPKGFPMYTNDIKQLYDMLNCHHILPEQEGDEHNALVDARWNKKAWDASYRMANCQHVDDLERMC